MQNRKASFLDTLFKKEGKGLMAQGKQKPAPKIEESKAPPTKKQKSKSRSAKKAQPPTSPWVKVASILSNIDFIRLFRVLFLALVVAFIVYQYILLTKGIFIKTYAALWHHHKMLLLAGAAFITYTSFIFYLGYRTAKKR
ncbi:hypothetical protein [Priestia megaterium]|uniref:hypothetical protein n=2 Tax=Bacillaceae TaxID=186817 RepID=UPI001F0A0B22|nr:hypothetical protein [Priestia megaterium]MED4068148.1 hypothetical protein [Priestia megaterium]